MYRAVDLSSRSHADLTWHATRLCIRTNLSHAACHNKLSQAGLSVFLQLLSSLGIGHFREMRKIILKNWWINVKTELGKPSYHRYCGDLAEILSFFSNGIKGMAVESKSESMPCVQ
jgi:hypothetical protein